MQWRFEPHGPPSNYGTVYDENGAIILEMIWVKRGPLIASAPDLLAALQELALLIEAEYPQQQEVWLAAARAAIAKAKGESQ